MAGGQLEANKKSQLEATKALNAEHVDLLANTLGFYKGDEKKTRAAVSGISAEFTTAIGTSGPRLKVAHAKPAGFDVSKVRLK